MPTTTSNSDIAISVRGLSKAYTIAHNAERHTTAAEALVHRLRHPFQRQEKETFWALKTCPSTSRAARWSGSSGATRAGKSAAKILSASPSDEAPPASRGAWELSKSAAFT
jgi:lipopolysaccharide transport system ATP-binding protein